ncbi:TlpA family protein disulfide reductase [Neolewinella litorea]|nr:TlpA disulfide reductase family protein [Neolewinella litorea]
MRILFLFFLAAWCGCSESPSVAPVGDLLGPASAPPVYADYGELSPLFEQRDDTTYLINFWATWCKPCLEELPLLQQLNDERSGEALRVVLVSLDTEAGAIERIPTYLESRAIDLPTVVLTDERSSWKRELDEKWDGSLPTTFVYRNDLRYIYRRPFRTLPDVASAVEPLLGK